MSERNLLITGNCAAIVLCCMVLAYIVQVKTDPIQHQRLCPSHKTMSRKVLDPKNFFGEAAKGYEAAATCPQILQHLFSYEGDDITDGHTCLLDCFVTGYGADDPSCEEEAILAADLYKRKFSLSQIQRIVDTKFAKEYPFSEDSPALKRYKAARLWDKNR